MVLAFRGPFWTDACDLEFAMEYGKRNEFGNAPRPMPCDWVLGKISKESRT